METAPINVMCALTDCPLVFAQVGSCQRGGGQRSSRGDAEADGH